MMSRIDGFKGCCDNGCVIKRPKGMGTNAKCRCPDYKLRTFIHALKAEIDHLKAQLKEAEEVLIRIRNYHTDVNIALGKMGECKCPDCCDILHYQKEKRP